jgi:murein DD-endopeptidase MepM/ murein hydrolase activator NlpD
MRGRRGKSRLAGVIVGAVFFGGLFFIDWSAIPQSPPQPAELNTGASQTRFDEAPPDNTAIALAAEPEIAVAGTSETPRPSPPPAAMVEARPGDTPLKLLARVGVGTEDAQEAARLLTSIWNPRDLRPGQRAAVLTQSDRLLSFRLALGPDRDIVIARDHTGGFIIEDQDRPTREVPTLGSGTIRTSLAAAAERAGVPPGVLAEMIRAFSYDIDFERDIQPGDTFTVLYDRVEDEFGRPTRLGQMVYAEMVLGGRPVRLFRFTPKDGEPEYFTAEGENTRKPLLRTPIDGARLSSGFGMRLHPILGYTRKHQGVDFAAPSGTEIYAAGDGTVVRIGRVGGYGNYVEVKHNEQYKTAYAHLSRFARGLKEGERVRQGEVIGYVGMTGSATGPHLHYEVYYRGEQVDPQSIKMPAATRLAGADLKTFEAHRAVIENRLIDLRQELIAEAVCRGARC